MRRIAGREAVRRAVEAQQRVAQSAALPGVGRSPLFRVLDQEFEAIAARRPERSQWDAVLRWLDEAGVRDHHGQPVTAKLLAVTWHQVRLAREARPLGQRDNGRVTGSDDAIARTRASANASITETRAGQGVLSMQDNGVGTVRRAAFGGEFAVALEAADRRSPLYLFLSENYDEICAHRPKHGGWHKFLAVVNQKGILDGQGNAVSMRVLWRTWEKVKKTVQTERNRPAARLSPQPVAHLRPNSDPRPVRETSPVSGGDEARAVETSSRPEPQPVRPILKPASSAWQMSPMATPDTEEKIILTLEQAWQIQRLRNQLLVEHGCKPNPTLDDNLVIYLDEESLRIFIEGPSTPAIGAGHHGDLQII